jgi:hypothetical protein
MAMMQLHCRPRCCGLRAKASDKKVLGYTSAPQLPGCLSWLSVQLLKCQPVRHTYMQSSKAGCRCQYHSRQDRSHMSAGIHTSHIM